MKPGAIVQVIEEQTRQNGDQFSDLGPIMRQPRQQWPVLSVCSGPLRPGESGHKCFTDVIVIMHRCHKTQALDVPQSRVQPNSCGRAMMLHGRPT